jgi:hypothetical protein
VLLLLLGYAFLKFKSIDFDFVKIPLNYSVNATMKYPDNTFHSVIVNVDLKSSLNSLFSNSHGIGYFEDGSIYEGNMKWRKITGKGTMKWGSKSGFLNFSYEGEWKDGEMNGKGKLTFSNGDIYEGEFVRGEREGIGTYYYTEKGDVYKGSWKSGYKDGSGTYGYKNGKVIKGIWERGKLKSQTVVQEQKEL